MGLLMLTPSSDLEAGFRHMGILGVKLVKKQQKTRTKT